MPTARPASVPSGVGLRERFKAPALTDEALRWNARYLEMMPWLRDVLRVGIPLSGLSAPVIEAPLLGALHERRVQRLDERERMHRSGAGELECDLGSGLVVRIIGRRTKKGGGVSVFHDVTAAERERAQARMNAEAANRAKSQFLATRIAPCGPPKPRNAVLLRVLVFAENPCRSTSASQ